MRSFPHAVSFLPSVTAHASHFFVYEEAQIWTSSGILGVGFHVLAFFLALFSHPCFPFALLLYFYPSVWCEFWWATSILLWNTQEHNKSISTSCVCKHGTLFFLEQFSHPLALWVSTQLCKESQAGSVTPILQTRKLRYFREWSDLQKSAAPPLHLYRRPPDPP